MPGALVFLEDEGGRRLQGVLTNQYGSFTLNPPSPGSYRLRAQRIGFDDGVSPVFALGQGASISTTIALHERAIELGEIVAQARRRCTLRPEAGLAVAQLWDEARKALEATAFTEAERVYGYSIRRYTRMLDANSMRVVRDSSSVHTTYGAESPYTSRPVAALLTDGFIYESDRAVRYDAPDAHVLLSDDFADVYCLRAEVPQPDTGEHVGIAFEPVDRTGPPAIRGTLWLDSRSYELRWLEYQYTRTQLPFAEDARVGGRVDFEAMPDGTWIVRRWHIRAPAGARPRISNIQQSSRELVLTQILEEGGEVLDTRLAGRVRQLAESAIVEGVVYDSARAAPVPGVLVYVSGTSYSAETDAAGAFTIDGMPEGEYGIGFIHPELQRFSYYPAPIPLRVRRGERSLVELALPPGARAEAVTNACAADADHQGEHTGILYGRVTDPSTGGSVAGAAIRVIWTRVTGRPTGTAAEVAIEAGLAVTRETIVVESDEAGHFLACALPRTRPLNLQVVYSGREGAVSSLDPMDEVPFAEIILPLPLP